MAKNEKTSKAVASKASWIQKGGAKRMDGIIRAIAGIGADAMAKELRFYKKIAESVAGSALTQAPDKKGRPKK